MSAPKPDSPDARGTPAPAAMAAIWVMRHDRGLSPAEQDEYLHWLAADPLHAEAMARQRRTWENFDRLAGFQASVPAKPDPDLLAPARRPSPRRVWSLVAVALAAAAVGLLLLRPGPRAPVSQPVEVQPSSRLTLIEERTLEDGSKIRLNRGAIVVTHYSPGERRVRLERGEADFIVAKDAARPFVVESGGVGVRAVGTAFNVRLAAHAVEVIVTEGRVAVTGGAAVAGAAITGLAAGQRAIVPLDDAGTAPQVDSPPTEELARRLAWQPRLLVFTDEPLAAILNEFNLHNPVVLRLADPALRELRLTVRFRSDNVEGFLRLLAQDFGVGASALHDGEIVLSAVR